MAIIAQTTVTGVNGSVAVTQTTLSASDTLVYSSGTGQTLTLINTTAGELTATIDGSGSTTISPTGYGGTVSVASGYAVVVAAGATKAVRLDTISAFLSGTVTVTGGADLIALLTK